MELKQYQENVLATLREFFSQARRIGHTEAYKEVTSTSEMKARLGVFGESYKVWKSIADVPRVCLKVPTGGGKTILAAHAIRIAAESWLDVEFPMVIWFTPSDIIRRQTAAALQNPRHPYRKVLDEQFAGKVRVYDIDEKFNITPQDIRDHVCIIVSTVQSFKQSDTGKYNVYKHNENLESHFSTIRPTEDMEYTTDGKLKFSFANLLHAHRPLMVMDEAHNAVTELSEEMQSRLYPSAIIELTATPRPQNNTLYSVYADELKREAMIKLPVNVVENSDWTRCITQAVLKRDELEKLCEYEREYIRPILLFQAEAKTGEAAITCERVKAYLIQELNVGEEEIAIATGEQRELDNVNVFEQSCQVRYVITVQALKEGWDCPFAYVLCSVANIKSKTFIQQLLGRVLRMPYASFRQKQELNEAYAYVRANGFGEAADELVRCLKASGFDDEDASNAVIVQRENPTEALPLFTQQYSVTFEEEDYDSDEDKEAVLALAESDDVPVSIIVESQGNGAVRVAFTNGTTQTDVDKICRKLPESKAASVKTAYERFCELNPSVQMPNSPASLGKIFRVPKLMAYIQGELTFAEPDKLFEGMDWHVKDWAKPQLSEDEFCLIQEGNAFKVDIDGMRVCSSIAKQDAYLPGLGGNEIWSPSDLARKLVEKVKQPDIPHAEMLEWVSNAVHYLSVTRSLPMAGLVENRFRIVDKLIEHINRGRAEAKKSRNSLLFLDAQDTYAFTNADKYVIEFAEDIFDNERLYTGNYLFNKHYTKKVPAFDGKGNGNSGEEFQCARALDSMPQVSYWVRNVAQRDYSFRLPLAESFFYPDFVAKLEDGRIFVVEYKGKGFVTTEDTAAKNNVGKLWARKSNNLYLLVEYEKNGLSMQQQLISFLASHPRI